MGNEESAIENGILYVQWSLAAEEAQVKAVRGDSIKSEEKGRGMTPSYKWVNGFEQSAKKPIQHMQWEMKNEHAVTVADLYTTLWGTIAGVFRRMAGEAKKDTDNGNRKLTVDGIKRDWHFFYYLTNGKGSPLRSAMKKAKLSEEEVAEWVLRIWCPYGKPHEELNKWADEAKKMSEKHARLATEDAGNSFQKWISDSLDAG